MPLDRFSTHEVMNQSPPFEDVNLMTSNAALLDAVKRCGAGWAVPALTAFGAKTGSREGFEIGRLANESLPKLHPFDDKGFRRDIVEFHPAYHEAMAMSFAQGLHASPWEHLVSGASPAEGRHVARAAGIHMMTQMEPGHVCPITMTNAAVATLLLEPSLAKAWLPLIVCRQYDRAFRPWREKASVTLGMGMTEKQGGTDVRSNATTATPVGARGPGAEYLLVGHKWFMSAPMCDAFLILAQAPGGLSCFLVPRFLPDGSVNALRFQRLKEKLGNRSNASSEVEIAGAHGWLVGEEGRGVPSIIEMVTLTRLDCAVASAGQMRLAVALAAHHCRHRTVLQRKLIDQPLMASVIADMALTVEAATALAFRLARSFDRADADEGEAAWRRVMTSVTKYWVCKLAPQVGYEAMECLGGNGYVEAGLAARLYREMPLNAIWEGSGNVMALDLLRVIAREAASVEIVIDEILGLAGGDPAIVAAVARLRGLLGDRARVEAKGRLLIELLASAAAAAILRAGAPTTIADGFIATRLGPDRPAMYGASLEGVDVAAVLARA